MAFYILIDTGTTNTRVSLLDENWQCVEQTGEAVGVRNTAMDGNPSKLYAAIHDCISRVMAAQNLSASDIRRCVAYGMITSNVGICEVPHLIAPTAPKQFREGMVSRLFSEIAPFPIEFIPGLRNSAERARLDNLSELDMMRGEETEAIGIWAHVRPEKDMMLILPGSHNKFISIRADGTICGCMTSISGELIDALTYHTILSDSVERAFLSAEAYQPELMLAGARACDAGLGRSAFMARIMRTLGDFTADDARNFLLGAVLRMDLDALEHFSAFSKEQTLVIAGKAPLAQALCDLFEAYGLHAMMLDEGIRKGMGMLGVRTICEAE